MNLNFYNHFHNGDVHFSRQFVKDIINKYEHCKCYYAHPNRKGILKDIPHIEEIELVDNMDPVNPIKFIDDNVYINTWIGQSNMKYAVIGLGLDLHYEMYKIIYDKLNIKLENIEFYHPTIDYNYVHKNGIDEFLLDKKNILKVLICNNIGLSYQSSMNKMDTIIFKLASEFKNVIFILTSPDDINLPNVYLSKDFTNTDMDILEISYLSLFCDIIVGRSTTPYGSCNVMENIKNDNKVFISFCNSSKYSWSPSSCEKYIWSSNYNNDYIIERISQEIRIKI